MQPISLHSMRVYATWKRIFPRCRQNDAHSASHSARSIHPRNHGCNHAVRDAWSARFLRCLPVDCPRSTLVTSSKLGDSLPVVCVHYAGHTWSVHARNPRFTFNRLRMFTWTRVPSFLTRFQQLSRCVPHTLYYFRRFTAIRWELHRHVYSKFGEKCEKPSLFQLSSSLYSLVRGNRWLINYRVIQVEN